jgi:hypothetical protein
MFVVYYSGDQIKKDEMSWVYAMHGTMRNTYNILGGKSDGKKRLGKPKRRFEDVTKTNLN